MCKEFKRLLSEYNYYQRKGIDQTENYILLFEGNSKIVDLAKIDAVKKRVRKGAFYLSRKKSNKVDEYLVIDMFKGHVYKINSKHYTVKVDDDNILVINNKTGIRQSLIVNEKLRFGDIKHLGIPNYTYSSGDGNYRGIPSVRFENDYKYSIRVHWIIALMHWGIETLNKCVGSSPTHRLRRKITYKISNDNSISNLEIKVGTDNYKGEK
ncbi:hypothetical protein [Lysinibacillus capsici]|uniref:hypothetical protein n=1 Tax=Lysinibacillus capsici TaxID=2115968 RepID=UPI00325F9F59